MYTIVVIAGCTSSLSIVLQHKFLLLWYLLLTLTPKIKEECPSCLSMKSISISIIPTHLPLCKWPLNQLCETEYIINMQPKSKFRKKTENRVYPYQFDSSDQSYFTYRSCETTKLHFLTVHNVTRIRVFPLLGYHGCFVCVDQKVKGAWFIQ